MLVVWRCSNVEAERRIAVLFGATTMALSTVLGRRWVEVEVGLKQWMRVGMWEGVVMAGSLGWGSSDGGPRRRAAVLLSGAPSGVMGWGMAALVFL